MTPLLVALRPGRRERQPLPGPVEWLVVGLGNPGPQYVANRHNVGFQVVDALARQHGLRFRRYGKADVVHLMLVGHPVLVVKPRTFVNLSGDAVRALVAATGVPPARCLVVCDDLDLPLGAIRLRERGGAGGHRGLRSIIERLGTEAFPRVRIGIGRPPEEERLGRSEELVTAHVLGNFRPEEQCIIEKAIAQAVAAVAVAIAEGLPAAMNRFNQPGRGAAAPTAS
jgi:PTH1 family peptidyl-tRNA hydrolase